MPRAWLFGLLMLGLAGTGCEPAPRAPSLENTTIYQDATIGLRFLAPQGWILYARTVTPRGTVDKPIRLVGYQRGTPDGRADLELYIADYPAEKGLMNYLAEHPIGPEKWQLKGEPTTVNFNGVQAKKYLLVSVHQSFRQRDFWEIRRSDQRVILFICTAMTADRSTREQASRAVETATFELD